MSEMFELTDGINYENISFRMFNLQEQQFSGFKVIVLAHSGYM